MIAFPSGVRVWLATGHTDMRKGFDGLSLLVQETFSVAAAATCGLLPVSWTPRLGVFMKPEVADATTKVRA